MGLSLACSLGFLSPDCLKNRKHLFQYNCIQARSARSSDSRCNGANYEEICCFASAPLPKFSVNKSDLWPTPQARGGTDHRYKTGSHYYGSHHYWVSAPYSPLNAYREMDATTTYDKLWYGKYIVIVPQG